MEFGGQFVTTPGMILMLEWCVHRWATPDKVHDTVTMLKNHLELSSLQLGSVSRRAAYFGESSYGPVSIANVQCSGSETRLQNCGLSQTPSSTCTHSRDAGITCVGKKYM